MGVNLASASTVSLGASASKLLTKAITKEVEHLESFLAMLNGPDIAMAIEDSKTFSDVLRYALERGFIRQNQLADRIHYVNSQVGRWASGKAAPPRIVREAVMNTMRTMISERLDSLPHALEDKTEARVT